MEQMAGQKPIITKKTFKLALENSNGTRANIARRLTVVNSAITAFLIKNPEMIELLDAKRLSNIDRAEEEIFLQLDYDDEDNSPSAANVRQKAATYILGRLGKTKGWVEKTEVEHSGSGKIEIITNIPKEVEELLDESTIRSNS